ncbi:endonuclease SmrB [Buchnera aphidicola (Mollitrichosiphum nigrofasciatum)]|uniref:endonuclease SmrB n=1 Tax=Buchnera aphidicola TaxID=9 RepID=UPI0031B84C75
MSIFEKDDLFRACIKGTQKFKQDKVFHNRGLNIKKKDLLYKKNIIQQEMHSFYFSNTISNNKKNYIQHNFSKNIFLKKNNKFVGKYNPEIYLDLHGVSKYNSKKEIGILITLCYKENFSCAGIIHGHGRNILKKQIPFWLKQHPEITVCKNKSKNVSNTVAVIFFINLNV